MSSCAFLLELCGLSATMLGIDITALRRISSFYRSTEINDNFRQLSQTGSAFHAVSHESDMIESLARALADDYLHDNTPSIKPKGTLSSVACKRPSRALMLVLQHLEKASLPLMVDGNTCGSWLLSGNGNGTELRSQQKAASQHWNLVTVFCRMHKLPLSTKYLTVLAKDNDWVCLPLCAFIFIYSILFDYELTLHHLESYVSIFICKVGFLSEAQVGGYPFDTVLQIVST